MRHKIVLNPYEPTEDPVEVWTGAAHEEAVFRLAASLSDVEPDAEVVVLREGTPIRIYRDGDLWATEENLALARRRVAVGGA